MKRLFFSLATCLTCISLTFVSCSKDDSTSGGNLIPASELAKYPYSSLTPEQQKEKLSDDANSFLSQIQDLNKEKSVEVLQAFSNLLNEDPATVGRSELRSASDIIQINSFYGNFTWQASSRTWTEEQSDHLEFNFPVGSSAGKIVITGVSSGKNYTYEEYYEYYDYSTGEWLDETETTTYELPKQLSAKIQLDGSEVGSAEVNADIVDDQSVPKSVTACFNLGSYKFAENYDKASGKATASLLKGNTSLLNSIVNVSGNVDDLLNNEVSLSGNFTIQLMDNLAFAGNVDLDNYGKEMNTLDATYYPYPAPDNYDWSKADENYYNGAAVLFNKYFDVYLVSVKDKTKIAKLTRKAIFETSYWDLMYMFQFNDSTEVDSNVYFTDGFGTVMDNWEKFINSLE